MFRNKSISSLLCKSRNNPPFATNLFSSRKTFNNEKRLFATQPKNNEKTQSNANNDDSKTETSEDKSNKYYGLFSLSLFAGTMITGYVLTQTDFFDGVETKIIKAAEKDDINKILSYDNLDFILKYHDTNGNCYSYGDRVLDRVLDRVIEVAVKNNSANVLKCLHVKGFLFSKRAFEIIVEYGNTYYMDLLLQNKDVRDEFRNDYAVKSLIDKAFSANNKDKRYTIVVLLREFYADTKFNHQVIVTRVVENAIREKNENVLQHIRLNKKYMNELEKIYDVGYILLSAINNECYDFAQDLYFRCNNGHMLYLIEKIVTHGHDELFKKIYEENRGSFTIELTEKLLNMAANNNRIQIAKHILFGTHDSEIKNKLINGALMFSVAAKADDFTKYLLDLCDRSVVDIKSPLKLAEKNGLTRSVVILKEFELNKYKLYINKN